MGMEVVAAALLVDSAAAAEELDLRDNGFVSAEAVGAEDTDWDACSTPVVGH
jgi:hypothetical protein